MIFLEQNPVVFAARGLSKTFGSKTALKCINLSIYRGKIIGLLGPNGSGKTTLIKLIAGLIQPDAGEIRINGKPIGVESKLSVAYLPDKCYLNEWMKVRELVEMFSDFYSNFDAGRAHKLIADLGINEETRLKALSKGNQEKIQLILVMSRKADLYLLDEPIGGVDPAAREYIINTIIGSYDENAAVIISTHLISDIENVLDEAIFLKEGEISIYDNCDRIREQSGKSLDGVFREVFRCSAN